MSRIRSKNTHPEIVVRRFLHGMGLRFRIHRNDLPGSPDIVLPKYRTIVFVHGCFWHQHMGCNRATIPKTKKAYWEPKLKKNAERDQRNTQQLKEMGWRVLVVWECELNNRVSRNERLKGLLEEITGHISSA